MITHILGYNPTDLTRFVEQAGKIVFTRYYYRPDLKLLLSKMRNKLPNLGEMLNRLKQKLIYFKTTSKYA